MIQKTNRLVEIGMLAARRKPHLIKFGQSKYLEKYSFKISIASSFDDPSLNLAQIDDEMKAFFTPKPDGLQITYMNGDEIPGIDLMEITFQIKRDYYVFCTSRTFDYRLFGDFDADACLFIYDSYKFSEDIYKSMVNQVHLKDHAYRSVDYRDPIQPQSGNPLVIEFHKDIKYLYQNEYRHVFVPTNQVDLENSIFVNLPDTAQYSELFCL